MAAILGLLRVQSAVRAPYSFNLRHVTWPTQESRQADHSITYERRTEAVGCDLPLEQELR